MSEIKGPEPIADRVAEILKSEMPSKLAALDALFRDFTLRAIQAYYIGDSDGKYVWPCITISDAEPETLAAVSDGRYLAWPLEIAILDLDEGGGYQRLTRSLWRYQRAVTEILHTHKTEAGYWLGIPRIEPITRGPYPVLEVPEQMVLVKGVRAWFLSTETF